MARKKETEPIKHVTSKEELENVLEGEKLAESVKGTDCESEITEYLHQFGLAADAKIQNKEIAERERHERYRNYHNIRAFLKNYRRIRGTYEILCEEFEELTLSANASEEARHIIKNKENLFTALSRSLDLMSVQAEKEMRAKYEPRIAAGRRYEFALDSIQFGLKVLQKQDSELYELLNWVYIAGDSRPTVKETLVQFDLGAATTYYARLEKAEKQLSSIVFGDLCPDRKELLAILVGIRQQVDAYDELARD